MDVLVIFVSILVVAIWGFVDPTAFIQIYAWWGAGAMTFVLWFPWGLFFALYRYNSAQPIFSIVFLILTAIVSLGILTVIVYSAIILGWKAGLALFLSQGFWAFLSGFIVNTIRGKS